MLDAEAERIERMLFVREPPSLFSGKRGEFIVLDITGGQI